jgi:hypothetical protein
VCIADSNCSAANLYITVSVPTFDLVIPIPIPSGDKIAEIINEWLKKAIYGRKEKREKDEANLLYLAAFLVRLARDLDNGFREIISELFILTADWSHEQREMFNKRLNKFATEREIIDRMDMVLQDLRGYELDILGPDTKNSITKIIRYGEIIRQQAGNSKVTPFINTRELFDLLDRVMVQTPETADRLREETEKRLDTFDSSIISKMSMELGILIHDIRSRNPTLPYPDWITSI